MLPAKSNEDLKASDWQKSFADLDFFCPPATATVHMVFAPFDCAQQPMTLMSLGLYNQPAGIYYL